MEVMAGVCLFIQSIWDMRTRKIPSWISCGFGICSFFYSICCQRDWISFIWALFPGILCLLLAVSTREKIGYGDGMLLCSLAMLYSLEDLIKIIMIASLFAGITGLILLIVFQKNGKYEIPFVPFLFCGWLLLYGINMIKGL